MSLRSTTRAKSQKASVRGVKKNCERRAQVDARSSLVIEIKRPLGPYAASPQSCHPVRMLVGTTSWDPYIVRKAAHVAGHRSPRDSGFEDARDR